MRPSVRIALAGTAVLAGISFASPAFAAEADYPGSAPAGPSVSATEVNSGQSVTFGAGGFRPNSSVAVRVSDGRSFSAVADENGRISLSISFGEAGTYEITAAGVDSDGAARTVSSSVEVSGGGSATSSSDSSDSSASSASSDSSSGSSNSSNPGGLPFTGLELGSIVALGAATVAGGATLRVVGRRRAADVA